MSVPEAFEVAFSAMTKKRVSALIVLPDPMFFIHRRTITTFALKARIPSMYETSDFVKAGGLMAYGPDSAAIDRRAGVFVGKILKGAKPADLPVEQPTKFELVINLKTAKALGLTIPQSVLLRADEVIR